MKKNKGNVCKKYKNVKMNNIESIEKWILDECNCNICKKDNYITKLLQSTTIKKENTIQLNELTLTSKMIIKIQTELMKKHLLDTICII
jgi:hypothetical protein